MQVNAVICRFSLAQYHQQKTNSPTGAMPAWQTAMNTNDSVQLMKHSHPSPTVSKSSPKRASLRSQKYINFIYF